MSLLRRRIVIGALIPGVISAELGGHMRPFLIKTINCVWLILVVIGLPAIAEAHVLGMELASAPMARRLMAWGLGLGAVANAGLGAYALRNKKEKRLSWEWAAGFLCLCAVVLAVSHGYLNFEWLKRSLLWVRDRF